MDDKSGTREQFRNNVRPRLKSKRDSTKIRVKLAEENPKFNSKRRMTYVILPDGRFVSPPLQVETYGKVKVKPNDTEIDVLNRKPKIHRKPLRKDTFTLPNMGARSGRRMTYTKEHNNQIHNWMSKQNSGYQNEYKTNQDDLVHTSLPSIEVSYWNDETVQGFNKVSSSTSKSHPYNVSNYLTVSTSRKILGTGKRNVNSPRGRMVRSPSGRNKSEIGELLSTGQLFDKEYLSDIQEELKSGSSTPREGQRSPFLTYKGDAYCSRDNSIVDTNSLEDSESLVQDVRIRKSPSFVNKSPINAENCSEIQSVRKSPLSVGSYSQTQSLTETMDFDEREQTQTMSRNESVLSNIDGTSKDKKLQRVNNRVKMINEIQQVFVKKSLGKTSPGPDMDFNHLSDGEVYRKEFQDKNNSFNKTCYSLTDSEETSVQSVKVETRILPRKRKVFLDEKVLNTGRYIDVSEVDLSKDPTSRQEGNVVKGEGPNIASNPGDFTWQQLEELTKSESALTSEATNDNEKQSIKTGAFNNMKDSDQAIKERYNKRLPQKQKSRLAAVVRPTVRKNLNKGKKNENRLIESEIPGIYSDDDDIYLDPRPHTDTYRTAPPIDDKYRYEQPGGNDLGDQPPKPGVQKSYSKKGRLVTFFRNGDVNFKGKTVCINQKNFATFETLLVFLTEKIPTTSGVHYIFTIPDGREIKSITEFVHGRAYVVSSNKKPEATLNYGYSKEQFWVTKRPSAGKFRKNESELLKRSTSPSNSPMKKPRVITVIHNTSRERREKIFINPNSHLNFEELLNTIEDVLDMSVLALHTEKPPHQKVESYSQILREFKKHNNFIACGAEPPLELTKTPKRQAPSSNSSSDSTGLTSRKKKLLRQNEFDGIEETDGSPSPPPPISQQQMLTDDHLTQGIMTSYRTSDDPVHVDIHGKTREYHKPLDYDDNDGSRPDKKLKLEWIYGYRPSGTYNNLLVYATGELLYHVAAVAVLFNKSSNTQRHYLGHTEEISCMSLHPNKRWIATGQISGKTQDDAHIRIWDGQTLSTYNVIGMGFFKVGITSIGFSAKPNLRRDIYSKYEKQSGFYMCALDSSDKHVLSVWDWQQPEKERLIAHTTTSIRSVSCACFYPKDHTILITYGEGHVYFWQLFWNPERETKGRLLRDKDSGIFVEETPRLITSITFTDNGDVITGDSGGSITVWSLDENYAFKVNKILSSGLRHAHRKPVTALCMLSDGTLLSGGGIEVRAWDSGFNYKGTKDRRIPDVAGDICAIVPIRPDSKDGELYIGTSKSCILEGSLQRKFIFRVHGHSNELWSIEPHPEEPIFFTAAHDQLVIKWISTTHRIAWRIQVENPCSTIALDRRGKHLAIGTVAGQLILLNAENGMHIITVPVGGEQINAIKYSPDESMLALGDHGGCIHIFYVHEDGRLYRKNNAKLKGNGSFVTHLDWSSDSRFLQSSNGEYDLKYWNVEDMQQIKDEVSMRDVNWYSFTCNVGYAVFGAWTNLECDEHLHVTKRSNYRDVIITGDNHGRLRLYKYPCAAEKPDYRGTKLYSSDVTAVNFLYDDTSVISSGGMYPVMAQWTVVDR